MLGCSIPRHLGLRPAAVGLNQHQNCFTQQQNQPGSMTHALSVDLWRRLCMLGCNVPCHDMSDCKKPIANRAEVLCLQITDIDDDLDVTAQYLCPLVMPAAYLHGVGCQLRQARVRLEELVNGTSSVLARQRLQLQSRGRGGSAIINCPAVVCTRLLVAWVQPCGLAAKLLLKLLQRSNE